MDILPVMRERWTKRKRPLPPELAWAAERYSVVNAVNGSTLLYGKRLQGDYVFFEYLAAA